MTNIYNVHIYREMRLAYEGIEADSHEEAAALARDKPTNDAVEIDDCEGETLSALVDVAGDDEYEQSRFINFEDERQRKAAPALLAACRMVVERWERGDLAEAARACHAAIEQAAVTSPPKESLTAALPNRFDDYEIHGVYEFSDDGRTFCEQVADDEAQFWSLYGHIHGQGAECIGDFKTRNHAEEVYARITGRRYGSRS